MKILLVEDSSTLRKENERALLKAGYEVVCANVCRTTCNVHVQRLSPYLPHRTGVARDGESALTLAREQKPELILLDMILPRMSGPEVLEHLKQDAATASIPVVVLSSLTAKNRQKLIEAGADEYLEKSALSPVPGTNLLPKILEDIICRINRKRGIAFSSIPVDKRVDS